MLVGDVVQTSEGYGKISDERGNYFIVGGKTYLKSEVTPLDVSLLVGFSTEMFVGELLENESFVKELEEEMKGGNSTRAILELIVKYVILS